MLIVVKASHAPINSIAPIKTNQSRVASDRRPCLRAQQCLYFLPLPQGHGSLRPGWLLKRPPLRRTQTDQRKRVHTRVEQAYTPVEVRARYTARRPRETELLAALHDFADSDVDLR
jgi:hypothetical protein